MKRLIAGLLLLASPAALAQVGGYVNGGVSFGSYNAEDSDDFELDLEGGTGYNITGGLRFHPGLEAKLTYVHVTHEGGDVLIDGDVIDSFNEDVEIGDLRIGLFYAPPQKGTVGFRVGGGYVRQSFEIIDDFGEESITDGFFIEGSLLINAGKIVSIDLGGAFLGMEDEEDGEAAGFELHGMLVFHAGPVDIGLGVRGLGLVTEYDDDDDYELEEGIGEFRLTIGGAWGYPKAKKQ